MQDSINPILKSLNSKTEYAIKQLFELTNSIQSKELNATVKDILDRLGAPFTFVIFTFSPFS